MNSIRVALITGASRGIGRGIAKRLATAGFHVIVNYRASATPATEVVREICNAGGSAEAYQADVTDLTAVREMISYIRKAHSRIDVLVNSAGRSEDGLLLMMTHEKWWRLLEDNVSSVVNPTRSALPMMLAAKRGTIINISSISGIRGVEGQTAYSAAKAAVIGFTKALARELSSKGIIVNCVAPGPIDTEMYQSMPEAKREERLAILPLRRMGRVEEVAEVVALLAEGKASFIHGQVIAVDGGATI